MKNLSKLKILGFFVSLLYFSIIFLSVNFAGLSILDATKDNPLINNEESIFYGLVSNIGIFLWMFSLTLNLYAYLINKDSKIKNIFLVGAINSFPLLIADLFDLQNDFQNIVYFFLIIISLIVFLYSRRFPLIKNKLIILFCSFSFLSGALIIDILQIYKNFPIPYSNSSLVEELFEFLGGFYYTFYWIEAFRKINKQKKNNKS